MIYETGNTVGVEIEFNSHLYSGKDIARARPTNWKFDHDGSCSKHKLAFQPGIAITNAGEARVRANREEFGGELVSPPMLFDSLQLKKDLKKIFTTLPGEVPDISTGIHIHVCVGYPQVEFLKRSYLLGRLVEKAMYRLSCGDMRHHRGEENNYKYCRPLSDIGRQAVWDTNDYLRWAYDKDCLAKAATTTGFLQAFCRADTHPSRWMPSRYYWLNYMSISTLGTLEFRLFNFVPEVPTILAWIDLCRAFVQQAGERKNIQYLEQPTKFTDLIDILGEENFATPRTFNILERLWFKGRFPTNVTPEINHTCTEYGRKIPFDGVSPELVPPRLTPEERLELPQCAD